MASNVHKSIKYAVFTMYFKGYKLQLVNNCELSKMQIIVGTYSTIRLLRNYQTRI